MKYMITFTEKPQGSPEAYEANQRRMAQLFEKWERPEGVRVLHLLTRIGSWSGYMLAEIDDIRVVQTLATAFATLDYRIEPVMDIEEGVPFEDKALAWRDTVPWGAS